MTRSREAILQIREIELRVAAANEDIRSRDIVIGGVVTELDLIIGSAGA
jgi:hypothetical protein